MTQAKQHRQRLIADLLRDHRIASQEELVARLDHAGVTATQATVSRDLDDLGAVRVRRQGALHYRLPDSIDSGTAGAQLDRLLGEWVTDILAAGPLLVLKTPPGSANLVANALDGAELDVVAGTIAGDDTIFVALREGVVPGEAAAMLRKRWGRG